MIRFYLFFSFCLLIIISCSSKQVKQPAELQDKVDSVLLPQKESFPVDSVIHAVTCTVDPSQSFALYLPPSYADSVKLPVIIFFDPHGDGLVPVLKYSTLAKQFGFILVGSNNSKNGMAVSETEQVATTLLNDIQSRIAMDERSITLSGFSGGAKVALAYGMDHPEFHNIIYAGAAIPLQHPNPSLSLLGFAGENDMNYSDLLAFDQSISATNMSHFLIEWNGKHEWPDTTSFRDAFYWVTFNSMRNHLKDIDEAIIRQFSEQNEKERQGNTDPVTVAMSLNKARFFLNGISSTDHYSSELSAIEKGKQFQEAMRNKEQLMQQEQSLKQDYYKAFQEKDLAWWKKEVARMNGINDPKLKPMYQRLLGFLSLAGYSISSNAIRQNQMEAAKKMLAIYKIADPANPDQSFLQACYFSKLGEQEKAVAALKESVELGLNDRSKIMDEPALSSLHSLPEFISLVSSLPE